MKIKILFLIFIISILILTASFLFFTEIHKYLKTKKYKKPLELEKEILNKDTSCKNFCGDGICQEIVCMAIGCPCPETKVTCSQDCK